MLTHYNSKNKIVQTGSTDYTSYNVSQWHEETGYLPLSPSNTREIPQVIDSLRKSFDFFFIDFNSTIILPLITILTRIYFFCLLSFLF